MQEYGQKIDDKIKDSVVQEDDEILQLIIVQGEYYAFLDKVLKYKEGIY